MPGTESDVAQGPRAGSRCVAAPDGRWAPAAVRRVNEDGSFTVEFDVKGMVLLPYWYGVTPAEISFDDDRQWAPVFARISPDGRAFSRDDFGAALHALGYPTAADRVQELWDQGVRNLPDHAAARGGAHLLDAATTYEFFLGLGLSAKLCAENLQADRPKPYFKLYWNQVRMGGRQPGEVSRPVTLDDAFAALGLTAGRSDRSAVAALQRFERDHGVHLPLALKELFHRAGVAAAVTACHPNNPGLVGYGRPGWNLRRGMRGRELDGDYALVIMTPHQGDHQWAAVFDDGEDDARVYVLWDAEDGDTWLPVAPGVGLFFWDLAQTGLAWFQDTQFKGGKRVKRSDIGLAPDPARGWRRFFGA